MRREFYSDMHGRLVTTPHTAVAGRYEADELWQRARKQQSPCWRRPMTEYERWLFFFSMNCRKQRRVNSEHVLNSFLKKFRKFSISKKHFLLACAFYYFKIVMYQFQINDKSCWVNLKKLSGSKWKPRRSLMQQIKQLFRKMHAFTAYLSESSFWSSGLCIFLKFVKIYLWERSISACRLQELLGASACDLKKKNTHEVKFILTKIQWQNALYYS